MTLGINCVYNFPLHLGDISKLPEITQKLKCNTDELKQRLIDTWQGRRKLSGRYGGRHTNPKR